MDGGAGVGNGAGGVSVSREAAPHASFVIRPGRHFVRRLLQLSNLHLSGAERAGGGEAWGKYRKRAQARRVLRLSREFMAAGGWWRWFLGGGGGTGGRG